MSRKTVIILGLVSGLLVAGAVLAQDALVMRAELAKARDAMADRNYPIASRLLTAFIEKYETGEQVEEAHVLAVRARLLLSDYEGALRSGREFLGAFAGSSWERKVRLLMGECYARMRGFKDAARIYREQVDFLSGDAHERKVSGYYLELARRAYEGEEQPDEFGRPKLVKDYGRALSYFLKARSIHLSDEDAPSVSHRIADCHFNLGQFGPAEKEWKSLLSKWPDAEEADDALYHVGLSLAKLGNDVEARTHLRLVRERFGDSKWAPHALIALGRTHHPLDTRDEGEYARGLKYWKEYRKLHPSHVGAEQVFFDIGEAAYRFGRFDEAVTEFRAFLAAFPEAKSSPQAQDRIAWCYYRKQEFDRAVTEWKTFLGRWPNHELWTRVQGMIAKAAFDKGLTPLTAAGKAGEKEAPALYARAETGFRAFLAGYPVHELAPQAQYLLGEIRSKGGKFAEAVTEWRIVATKYADTGWAAPALFRIAGTYEKDLNDLSKAIEGYENLVKRYPASGEAGTARGLLGQFRKKLLEVVTERAWRTDEKCVVKLRTRNIESLRIRAYRLNLEETFRRRLSLAEIEKVVVEVVTPDLELDAKTAAYEKYRLHERDLYLEKLTGEGAWIVTFQDEDLTATTLVLISDLTIVTKESPTQTLVFAVNERTGEPFPGVRLLIAEGGKIVTEGRTGQDGVYVRQSRTARGRVKVFAKAGGHVAATDLSVSGAAGFGYSTKVYLYTDRPLYRPGHEVKMKGIFRRVNGGGYATSAGEELDVSVQDPRGTVVFQERVRTNDYGTFSRDVYLSKTAAVGDYKILATTVKGARKTFQGGFTVREYKKPEFTITVRTDRRSYLPGEEVKFEVALRYFFGGPVPETSVRYQVARGPYAFDPSVHEEFAWFTMDPERERERNRRNARGYEYISEGELKTDADGNLELSVATEDRDRDATYVVSFEALDLNRQWVRETAPVVVTRQGFYVLAKTEKKVYRPGEKIGVRLTTVDAVHFPVPASGELVVARRVFVGDRETESIVSRKPAKTGEDGRATVEIKVDRPGEYLLKFVGEDRSGNRIAGGAPVTIAGEAEDLARHAKVVASRQIYREGEEAEVLVNSPVAPVWALLTFEGERVLDHRVVRLTERSTTLRLTMKPLFSPNVFVKIAIPKDHELHQASDEIYVFKYLDVKVAADRPEAKPGEKVSFTVTTTDQRGKPVPAEFSLALVDRSVLALAPDRAEQLKPYFYDQRRKLSVATGSSYAFRHVGTTRQTNKDLLWEDLRRGGQEKFNRTMKYVRVGKELLSRGDLEGAALEFRKALQLAPANYEAKVHLARTRVRLREQRTRGEMADKLRSLAEKLEDAEDANSYDRRAYKGKRPPAKPAPASKAGRPAAGGGWKGEKRAEAERYGREPAREDRQDEKGVSARFLGRRKDLNHRGRAENLFKDALPVLKDQPLLGALFFGQAPLVPPSLRKNFADTAAWRPQVVTGPDGRAELEVELPDNLTTWRAVVRGVTKSTLVGEATADLVARKDLLVRVDTPRFLTQKDRVTVTATVHNNLGETAEVHLAFAGENVTVLPSDSTGAARLRPGQIRPFDFRLAATAQGLAKLTATARTTRESDATETGLPVLPHGLKTFVGRSGEITEEALETFSLPGAIIPGTKQLAITLSPGIDGSILESITYLGGFPYGCLEQTVNRFLPAIAADQALRAIGSPNERLKAKLGKAVKQGLLALYSFQNADGSFGWFSGPLTDRLREMEKRVVRPGNPTMTALAILGMERARMAGYRISEPHRSRAHAAGQRLVKTATGNAEKALLLWALSRARKASLEDLNQVYRYRDGLGANALATLALAMHETKRGFNAASLVTLLKAKAVTEGGLTHWEGEGRFGVMNAVEATAFAIRALIRVEPDSGLIDGAVRWLLTNKRGPKWVSTRDTGAAVLALADHLVKEGILESEFALEVYLNDAEVPHQIINVVGGKVVDDQKRTIIVDGARLRTGENRIKFVKKGPGRLFYTMLLSYFVEADDIEAAGNLIAVSRRYSEYVSPVAAKEGKEEIKPGWTIVRPEARPKEGKGATIERAGSGDKFRIRLRITAREKLPYVILEDPLPAGVEVVSGQASGPFDWEERRDDKQVFFMTDVPAGTVELSYLVQAIHPGEFHAMPALAYPMYEPEIWGRSAMGRLTVVPESGVIGRSDSAEGITPDEIYALAVRDYKADRFEAARAALERLLADFALLDRFQEECQAMLLRANFRLGDAKRAVEAYERLVELNPRRGPKTTDERRQLAVCYQEIGEHERALSLLRGVTDEYLGRELGVAETYRAIGNPWLAQEFTERTLRSYPDSNAAVTELYRNAHRFLEMSRPESDGEKGPKFPGVDTGLMLPEALDGFHAFLSHYPESPLADESSRMAVTILTRMELPDEAVAEAGKFIRRYRDSVHLDDVYWYLAESYFSQEKPDYDRAMETGRKILDRRFLVRAGSKELARSPFVPHVNYLFAKIHHLRGELAEAVALYKKVSDKFEDARDALAFLTEAELRIPETLVFGTKETPRLTVERKNLTSLEVRLYPVDLLLLIAVKKDLRKANEIDLTGIATKNRVVREFPEGKDFRVNEEEIPLRIQEKGVYLVVAKAGDIIRTSIVIVSDLDMSVQVVGNRVRVYAVDRNSGEPMAGVFVKISDGKEIRAQGFTDARGVFEGRNVSGSVMVVAETDGHYALYRR